MQVELYGGSNSKINEISLEDNAFAHRDTMFTFQLYASSASYQPPYPDSGRNFLTGEYTFISCYVVETTVLYPTPIPSLFETHSHIGYQQLIITSRLGLVTNITTNVNDPSSLGAYLNYIDDDLDNCQSPFILSLTFH